MKATLTHKRRHPTRPHYIVDATCPGCGYCRTVGYGYWLIILCGGCGVELRRGTYRKARR